MPALAEAVRVTAMLLGGDTRLVSEASSTRPAEFGGFARQHNGIE
jgi:hypothetical protein